MNCASDVQAARIEGGRVPDYNMSSVGELLPGVLEAGKRQSKVTARPRKRLSPTNSERMNRALVELSPSAFKVHILLWKWRGAPAKGLLPFFTIRTLARFCNLTRPTVRAGLRELVGKGWIQKRGYDKHVKNELYSLIPIRDIPLDASARVPPPGYPPQIGGMERSL